MDSLPPAPLCFLCLGGTTTIGSTPIGQHETDHGLLDRVGIDPAVPIEAFRRGARAGDRVAVSRAPRA